MDSRRFSFGCAVIGGVCFGAGWVSAFRNNPLIYPTTGIVFLSGAVFFGCVAVANEWDKRRAGRAPEEAAKGDGASE